MASQAQATFVGFGFGAIQAGLFCYEAATSRIFRHVVVAEIVPEIVAAVRAAGGYYTVNVAHLDRIEAVRVGPVQMENPLVAADRARLIEAIAAADAVATAVPSVRAYRSSGPGSLHRVLAEGLARKASVAGPRVVVYAAENHPHAAAILRAAVMDEVAEAERGAVGREAAFVDTVIAKMSGVVMPPGDLAPLTPDSDRAFLVEGFNEILVSMPHFDQSPHADDAALAVGFPAFLFREDLTPYEEAKFFGHNGVHALAAYLGAAAGLTNMAELAALPGMVDFLRAALVEEVGVGLIRRYAGVDPLFTSAGMAAYADQLLTRMLNPYLRDAIVRVGRDPERKLGWEDRLLGAMRLAYQAGVTPERLALGAAAAMRQWDAQADPALRLPALWRQAVPDAEEAAVMLALIQQGGRRLAAWQSAGCPDLAVWWPQAVTAF